MTFRFRKDFLDVIPKAWATKEKNKWLCLNQNLQLVCIKSLKSQSREWEKIFEFYTLGKGLISGTYKELLWPNNNNNNNRTESNNSI